jgi:hypothetical protein
MPRRSVVMTAAWLEIVAGAGFVTAPDVVCRLLFASSPEGLGVILTRFAGLGLFSLGIACLLSRAGTSSRNAVLGLFAFNAATAILFAWVGVATTLRGVLLWPAVALHAGIAAALLPQLLGGSEIEA